MPIGVEEQVNMLVDEMEAGRSSVSTFLRGLQQIRLPAPGIGPLVRQGVGAAPAGPASGGFLETGVVVRIQTVDAQAGNVIEGMVRPGAVSFWQTFTSGEWEQEVVDGKAKIAISAGRGIRAEQTTMRQGEQVHIGAHQRFQLANTGKRPWRFKARHPMWLPDTFQYEYKNRRIPGREMWFELRSSQNDEKARPVYNVVSAGDLATYVLVFLEPGSETLRQYNTDGDNIVTAISGSVSVLADGNVVSINRGEASQVHANEPFQVRNSGQAPALVEILPDSPRMWNPDADFWEVQPGQFVPGSDVYFEFVLPPK